MKIGEKISVGLENIDRFIDRCGLSCLNNLVNLAVNTEEEVELI